jgi:hypothetical protein
MTGLHGSMWPAIVDGNRTTPCGEASGLHAWMGWPPDEADSSTSSIGVGFTLSRCASVGHAISACLSGFVTGFIRRREHAGLRPDRGRDRFKLTVPREGRPVPVDLSWPACRGITPFPQRPWRYRQAGLAVALCSPETFVKVKWRFAQAQ